MENPGDQFNDELFDRDDITEGDIKVSGKVDDKLITFTRMLDQRAIIATIALPINVTKGFYFEAKITMGNNSIAVGVLPDWADATKYFTTGLDPF